MKKLPYVNSYRALKVYKKAQDLTREIFNISKDFPEKESYSLTNQIRRSSRSIGAQIAEAWAKRFYKKHFVSKLTDSDAEVNETEHWIDTAFDCGYISKDLRQQLSEACREIGRIIGGMISKADTFCEYKNNTSQMENSNNFTND
jgi:four helix bundle protein